MIHAKLPKIWYGGDYNPEQWDKEVMDEDLRMFNLAGIDVVTINVFSWALSQPNEDTYDFTWLDDIINRLHANGTYVCLATSTGAHPAWMAKKYPDVCRVDFEGRKHKFGKRHNSCPNSPTYRTYSERIAERLAQRYKDHEAVLIWHVSNEYGGYCYCDNCAEAFRTWLQARYSTLDQLNKAWYTGFWGHTFYDWDEIVPPNALSEESSGDRSFFQSISLDYRRFMSDSLLDCYKLEYNAIRRHCPQLPITTNLMGLYKELDYFKWAPYLDVISWDNYPSLDTPVSLTSMTHDLMRGLKDGQPFMLMEQTPSQQNWQKYNSLKRPGVMKLWSYQAVAHGADTILFFQLRRSAGACEKFHGAVIEHVGHEHTRVFRECAELGHELEHLSDKVLDARVKARVGIVFDWENRWAVGLSSGPTIDLKYVDEVHKYYDALFQQNIQVDLIGTDTDLTGYDIVIAPVLYMVKEGYAKRVEQFVHAGGTFLTTFFSGIVNEHDRVTLGGYPGELRNVLGIWAEEIDALFPEQSNHIQLNEQWGGLEGSYQCGILCDLIHAEGAAVKAVYGKDFYQGMPALTVNKYGAGQAWYVASSPEPAFLQGLLGNLCQDKGIIAPIPPVPGVEVSTRTNEQNESFVFILNHNDQATTITLGDLKGTDLLSGGFIEQEATLAAKAVLIIEK